MTPVHQQISTTTELAICISDYTKAKSEPIKRKAHKFHPLYLNDMDTAIAIAPNLTLAN